jgi:uncharacterized alpha-E superfamily protein
MTVIEVSDIDAAALTAKAARQGLTLDGWLKMMAQDGSNGAPAGADPQPLQTVANIVLDAMRTVPPEAFANRPKDGASEHDHYLYGHPKRHS